MGYKSLLLCATENRASVSAFVDALRSRGCESPSTQGWLLMACQMLLWVFSEVGVGCDNPPCQQHLWGLNARETQERRSGRIQLCILGSRETPPGIGDSLLWQLPYQGHDKVTPGCHQLRGQGPQSCLNGLNQFQKSLLNTIELINTVCTQNYTESSSCPLERKPPNFWLLWWNLAKFTFQTAVVDIIVPRLPHHWHAALSNIRITNWDWDCILSLGGPGNFYHADDDHVLTVGQCMWWSSRRLARTRVVRWSVETHGNVLHSNFWKIWSLILPGSVSLGIALRYFDKRINPAPPITNQHLPFFNN